MAKIEELTVLINANADQFKAELSAIKGELAGLNQAAGVAGGAVATAGGPGGIGLAAAFAVGQVAAQAAMAAFRAVTSVIRDLTGQVISGGSQLARMKVATATVAANMGITAKEIGHVRAELADANTFGTKAEEVLKTLAFSGLFKMSEQLSFVDARTGKVVKGVTALTLAMKDLAAAAGIDSAEGIARVSKFIRTGNAAFVDGVIELGNLHAVYKQYADAQNKDVTNLLEQERAQARLQAVMIEARKALGAYANTYQTSGKAADSFKNAISSTAEEFGALLEPALGVAANAAVQFARSIRSIFVDENGALTQSAIAVRNFAIRVAGFFVALVRIVGMVLSRIPGIGKNFENLANFAAKPVKVVGDLGDAAGGASTGMDNAAGSAKKLKKELAGLAAFDELNVLNSDKGDSGSGGGGGSLGGIGGGGGIGAGLALEDFSADINKAADKWMEPFKNFVKGVKELIMGIGEFFKPIIEDIEFGFKTFIQPALDALVASIDDLFKSIFGDGAKASDIFKTMGTVIQTVLLGAVDLVIFAITGLIYVITGLAVVAKGFIENMKKGWKQWDDTIHAMSVFLNKVIADIGKWLASIPAQGQKAWSDFKKWATDSFTGIKNTASGVANDIVGFFKGIPDKIKGAWNSIGSTIKGVLRGMINPIISEINGFFRTLNKTKISIPGVGSIGFSLPSIPMLADGGVLTKPTIAMLAESSTEAVVPLENTSWMEELASKISSFGGGDQPMQLIVQLGPDKIFDKFVDWHNDKSFATNTVILK